jgi:hypothetical protein
MYGLATNGQLVMVTVDDLCTFQQCPNAITMTETSRAIVVWNAIRQPAPWRGKVLKPKDWLDVVRVGTLTIGSLQRETRRLSMAAFLFKRAS